MTELDLIIIHIYLLAIFATLVKQKTTPNIYRFLKFFVVVLFGIFIYGVFKTPTEEINFLYLIPKSLPLLILVVIIVQTEVRISLKFIGVKSGLLLSNTIEEDVKIELIKAIDYLSINKIGALITFERAMSLDEFIQTAFSIHAPISSELLTTIFIPKTPLHDGAVIIKGSEIVCAGTYFPPSENMDIPKYLGSRHRAAIGISEVTDSLTIIVSEQTGQISVAIDGYLDQDISKESLILYFEKYLQN
ncbi:diadenylate cyclase [Liberiplasma polymorphum]|uniref:diadenylate cyclase n=1 Tax=Liberiplasma polymorphum TaxID=3374570 RepID=UPI0037741F64